MNHEKCSQLLGELSAYLDGDVSDELCMQIERHLEDCDHCRRNERQCDIGTTAGEGLRRDAETNREGRRARSREGRNAGKGQMGP